MHKQGYDATSTTQIASAAGVSPATLFNYFPTKASIVFADDDLWTPRSDLATPAGTVRGTLEVMMLALHEQPAWTMPADDPLTAMRFELVRREPALAREQIARGFATVPAFAQIARAAHSDVAQADLIAEAGAVVGTVLAALTWAPGPDIRTTVTRVLCLP